MSGRRIRLLIWKEFLQLRRDPLLLRLLFIMPIAQLILFGYVWPVLPIFALPGSCQLASQG